jgi:hypothetical protein
MNDKINSIIQKSKNNEFLKNKIEIRCKCGYLEKITYHDLLSGGKINIGQPASIISPFISESVYDETIIVTPIHSSRKCPSCGGEITTMFPISLEDLIPILQMQPPDPNMYG